MASFTKYNCFVENLAEKVHNLQSDTLKMALTNTAPAATDTVWSTVVYPAPTSASGYTAGGNTLTQTLSSQTGGLYTLKCGTSTVFTASGGQIGLFRYVILYNSTASNALIGYYDYASSITLNDGETFTVTFDANGILTIQ